jgi:SAM-dependent methyltransferase
MSHNVHHKRTSCRACGGDRLTMFLSLGLQPLANAFLSGPEEFADEPRYPLEVYFCENCALVQLLDVIDAEALFRNYIYVTGTSETIAAHNVEYAKTVVDVLHLGPQDLVVEIASNDGSLLRQFQSNGVRTLGVEPARNLAEIARARGIETIDWFFNSDTGGRVRASHGGAKAIIANNVLAHVDDTHDFLTGARSLLEKDGLFVFEVPYLAELLDRLEYDTIYHEHLCYFSMTSLMHLCESAGLGVARVDRVPIHGGSLRVYAGLREGHAPQVLAFAAAEHAAGLDSLARYQRFAADVEESRRTLLALLSRLRSDGHTVGAYGAPAKGNTLLTYCGIDTSLISFTVDRNEFKVGRYTPGSHIPVRPVSFLSEARPDYALILAWNFAGEIMRQQHAYHETGGKFITPVPQPTVY